MSIPVHEKDRKILPRWRDFEATSDQRELAGEGQAERPPLDESFLEEKLSAWSQAPTTASAAELISSSIVFGKTNEGLDAARFILKSEDSGPLRSMAEDLIKGLEAKEAQDNQPPKVTLEFLNSRVRTLRAATRRGPRDPIAWLDLAHAYSSIGLPEKARRAVEAASSLAPESRFVARGIARFFVHIGEPDRAAAWLNSRPNVASDAWILAAEIATTSLLGRTSEHVRHATKTIEKRRWSDAEVTELASALATLELEAGNSKGSRKLFKLSLIQPSDNSVAQAEWAERRGKVSLLSEDALNLPRTFEARAKRHLSTGHFQDAIRDSWNWLRDEPFSREPAAFGSYVAALIENNNAEAERILSLALIANPHDALLLNNLAFSLASMGAAEKAREWLDRGFAQNPDGIVRATLTATSGLIHFRLGRFDDGRKLYRTAIDELRALGENKASVVAQLMLAREEKLARVPGYMDTIAQVGSAMKGIRDPELLLIHGRLNLS